RRQSVRLPPLRTPAARPHAHHARTLRGGVGGDRARGTARLPAGLGADPHRLRRRGEPDAHAARRAAHRRRARPAHARARRPPGRDAPRGAGGMSLVNLLLTNDDGIHAPGLRVLAAELAALGPVTLVAPDRDQSATSHSLTLHRPLRIHRHGEREFSIDGTPTDCVLIAFHGLLDHKPDLVVSALNHGPNTGEHLL